MSWADISWADMPWAEMCNARSNHCSSAQFNLCISDLNKIDTKFSISSKENIKTYAIHYVPRSSHEYDNKVTVGTGLR